MDRPTVADEFADEVGRKFKDDPNLIRAEVFQIFNSYAVINKQAFAQVTWQVRATWTKKDGTKGLDSFKDPMKQAPQEWLPKILYAGPVKRDGDAVKEQKAEMMALDKFYANYEAVIKNNPDLAKVFPPPDKYPNLLSPLPK